MAFYFGTSTSDLGKEKKQAEKLKSREMKEGWMKSDEVWMKNDKWRMMKDEWRMKNYEG